MSNITCIIYPPTLDYRYLVQRPQQLMKNFSELNIPVIYMDNPSPSRSFVRDIEQVNPYLYLFHNIDPRTYLKKIRPVFYFTATAHVEIIDNFNPSLVVFDSVDEPSDEFEPWQPYYHKALISADIVLATSEKLYHTARQVNPYTYLVPNGCDFDYFHQASTKSMPIPHDMEGISGPIIGYIGVVATWCDLELIEKMADHYPQYNFVMIGPLYNVDSVPQRPNLHWLGYKPYEQLAAYEQMFDAGIIPFRSSNMINSVNPIKMWEYMAAGLPIITTSIPEAQKYSDFVFYSATDAEFISNIQRALEEDTPDKKLTRIDLARQNSWITRAQTIIDIIEQRLQEKGIIDQSPVSLTLLISSSADKNRTRTFYPYINALGAYRQFTISNRVSYRVSKLQNHIGMLSKLKQDANRLKFSVNTVTVSKRPTLKFGNITKLTMV